MTLPDATAVLAAIHETWPAARTWRSGPWVIRDGAGGGRRASAATAVEPVTAADLAVAEAAQEAFGQEPIFRVGGADDPLLPLLVAAGYVENCPACLYACPIDTLTRDHPTLVTTFAIWPPLAIICDLWNRFDIPPERQAVMTRATCPRTSVLGRLNDRAAGAAYIGISDGIGVIHGLVVDPAFRRQGLAGQMMRCAAHWAASQGAAHIALAVSRDNADACALYASLGMKVVGQYHYRIRG